MNGTEMIAAERKRQIEVEGWTAESDDATSTEYLARSEWDLARAGACYAWDVVNGPHVDPSSAWPWDRHWWKPTPNDPVRQLVKAGALIAAEIDRLLRASPDKQERDHRPVTDKQRYREQP